MVSITIREISLPLLVTLLVRPECEKLDGSSEYREYLLTDF